MRIIQYIIIAFFALFTVFSCQKYTNEDTDGQWQLISLTLNDDFKEIDKKAERIMWAFQLDLLQIRAFTPQTEGTPDYIVARYRNQGDSLHITSTYYHFRDRDSLYTDPAQTILEPLGIHGNATSYKVERLTDNEMVLRSSYWLLRFRKY